MSADGYVTETREGVVLEPGGTTTEDFELRLDAPCPFVDPEVLDLEVVQGETLTVPLTLGNNGAAPYDFTITEGDGGHRPGAGRGRPVGPSPLPPGGRAAFGPLPAGGGPAVESFGTLNPDWVSASPVPANLVRYAHAQCEGDEGFWVIGGVADGSIVGGNYHYDAATDTWATMSPLPQFDEGPTGVCFDGKIYVMGAGGTTMHFIYDIATDTWSNGAALPRGVWGAAAGAFNGAST